MAVIRLNDDVILSVLAAAGVRANFRRADSLSWDNTLAQLAFAPVAYNQYEIDYQLAYQRGLGIDCQDLALVLYHDSRPCGIWPMSCAEHNGQALLTSYGRPLVPPLFVKELVNKSKKTLIKNCLDFVEAMCAELGIGSCQIAESFSDEVGLSDWHEQVMQRGATVSIQHELFVDLSMDIADIKARFRKSYKSLVTEGLRTWRVEVLRESNPAVWDGLRMLHQKMAGRVTRSIETWELQHQAIGKGAAFLVHLHNAAGELVGGGYFAVTRDEGVYNVGVYDRTLFAQPLGHVVQYRAIEEMKARGLRWYKIGYRPYPSQDRNATEKEVSIGEFKQGFATHVFPKFIFQHGVKRSTSN